MVSPRIWRRAVRVALLPAVLILSTLLVRPASAGFATLMWTAPRDNGGTTRVTYYDLRISMKGITGTDTLSWWNAATRIPMNGRVPKSPGTLESFVLANLVAGVRYYAIVKSADTQLNWSRYSNVAQFTPVSTITAVDEPTSAPAPAMVLGLPRPTPTSGRSDVNLDLPRSMDVNAGVFNAQGRLVRTLERGNLSAGTHVLHWDGRLDGGGDAASGVYWIRVVAGADTRTVKLIVAR